MAYDKSGSHLKTSCENNASQEEQRIMKVIELIFVAPWVFVIAVACIDVLREFCMDLRSYLVWGARLRRVLIGGTWTPEPERQSPVA